MSVAPAEVRKSKPAKILQIVPWVGMVLCMTALAAHFVWDLASRNPTRGAVQESEKAAQQPAGPMTVTLPEPKFRIAKVTTEPARIVELPTELGVPGRIEVNSNRRVEVRPRAPGVVREVHAVLGQHVKAGDPLVTLDSPDIGTARLNLRARQRELTTARVEDDWRSQIAATVAILVPEIRKGTDPAMIEKQFADRPLGTYRGTLLQTYSEYDIAVHEEEKTANLRSEQVIGEHPAVVAKHTREGLQQKLGSVIEQVRFDAAQEKRLADQRLRLAESAVIDAAQRLRILGVPEDIRKVLDHADRANEVAIEEDVTVYKIVAPFAGTIIARSAVLSQKADPNESLFTLADLRTVWVTASLSESDVGKLPGIKGGGIRLTATSYPGRSFPARLLSVGALVDPQTRTLPLLAQSDNAEGLLKPGLFVRISLDSPTSEKALTVPRAALVEIEGKAGVFLPTATEADSHSYSFHPVQAGREAGDLVVISSGLKEGQLVAATGTFLLKSELILQSQPEDE